MGDICDVHRTLMGDTPIAGQLRDRQNWIGAPWSTPLDAVVVPPPPEMVPTSLTTSVTTTRIGPTVHSISDRPPPPTHQTSQTVTTISQDRPGVTDSSTSTAMLPDQPRHSFGHPQAA